MSPASTSQGCCRAGFRLQVTAANAGMEKRILTRLAVPGCTAAPANGRISNSDVGGADSQGERLLKRVLPIIFAAGLASAAALPAAAATTIIRVVNFKFSPGSAAAGIGDEGKWHNSDEVPHTATSNTGLFNFYLTPLQSKTRAFWFAGAFPYYCRFHGSPGSGGGMQGRIE